MYFKNKRTGLVWLIKDGAHQRRLENDTGYVEVSGTNTSEDTLSTHHDTVGDSFFEKADYKSMDWQDLRKLAVENGINTHGKKRVEIEKELEEGGMDAS